MAAVATAAALHETLGVLVTATTSTSAPGDDEHVLNVYFSSVGNTWELACETRLRRTEHPNGVHSILFVREEEALGCGGPLLDWSCGAVTGDDSNKFWHRDCTLWVRKDASLATEDCHLPRRTSRHRGCSDDVVTEAGVDSELESVYSRLRPDIPHLQPDDQLSAQFSHKKASWDYFCLPGAPHR